MIEDKRASWPHAGGGTRIVPKGFGCYRRGRSWRRCPRDIVEVKELQQVGLRGVAVSQVYVIADKSVLDEPDHRRVVHRRMRNIMLLGERRDDRIRQSEAKLCAKS